MKTPQEIRLRALELALAGSVPQEHVDREPIIKLAERYYEFLTKDGVVFEFELKEMPF